MKYIFTFLLLAQAIKVKDDDDDFYSDITTQASFDQNMQTIAQAQAAEKPKNTTLAATNATS